jgi:nucleotide-binding universal stress UspA family protein
MVVVYVPFLRPFFDTVPLALDDWLLMLPFFFLSPIAMELLKLYFRRRTMPATAGAREGTLSRKPAPPQDAVAVIRVPVVQGGRSMKRVLVPVRGSPNCEAVVQQVAREFMNNTDMEVHLLNVQPRFHADVARFVRKGERAGFHREQAEKALAPCRQLLDRSGVPYSVHIEVGDSARCITHMAERLHCDHILLGTARKNTLTRLVEDSVTNRVLELTTVPVEVVAGSGVSKWERYGIPAALAALAAILLAAVD